MLYVLAVVCQLVVWFFSLRTLTHSLASHSLLTGSSCARNIVDAFIVRLFYGILSVCLRLFDTKESSSFFFTVERLHSIEFHFDKYGFVFFIVLCRLFFSLLFLFLFFIFDHLKLCGHSVNCFHTVFLGF